MGQSKTRESDTHTAGQATQCLFHGNPDHYHVHKYAYAKAPCPQPQQSRPKTLPINHALILSFQLCPHLPTELLPTSFPT
jgi:hypothetical protein